MSRRARYYTTLNIVDKKTGELVSAPALVLGNKPTYVDTKDHVKVFVTFLQDLIFDKDITKGAVRLLLYMLNQLTWNDLRITIIPRVAIKDLQVSRQTFYTWLDMLLEKGIIEKIDIYTYELIPYTAIRGSQKKNFAIKEEE